MHKKILGKHAEDIASRFLKKRGLKIIKRNFSCRLGEIDIIAKDGNDFVFVEVRSATNRLFHHPLESITYSKIKRLQKLALWWLYCRKLIDCKLRFDVVAVTYNEKIKRPEIEYIKDAF